MRRLIQFFTLQLTVCTVLAAQTRPHSLPSHPGAMLVDLDGFDVTQSSAKPGGVELGLRVHDHGNTGALIFLFLTPQTPHQDAASCLQNELKQVRKDMAEDFKDVKLNPDSKDSESHATMLITGKNGQYLYGFYGQGDQCLLVEAYPDTGTSLDLHTASLFLGRQRYDPNYAPVSADKFLYASILYRTQQYGASVPIYGDFLKSISEGQKDQNLRRVATDNMGMAMGISGDVDGARKVFQDAIKTDPDYPLYYYNLACADAEQGKAADAKLHLQQAFDRRANTLPGEHMPDPTTDNSILKLKKNKEFWTFVQDLK
ncbi:MAG: tetratricopeptide repeat protein [Acidobacteriaceae bacterium]|jgi:tetratricopeptide (TPR) repeat protein